MTLFSARKYSGTGMSYTAPQDDFTWTELGERIKFLRRAAGLTQVQLAEKAGLTQGGIFSLESGSTNPQLTTLQAIAGVFGISVRELITGLKPKGDSVAEKATRLLNQVFESADPIAIDVLMAGIENGLKIARFHGDLNRRPDPDVDLDQSTMRLLAEVRKTVHPAASLTRRKAPDYQAVYAAKKRRQK